MAPTLSTQSYKKPLYGWIAGILASAALLGSWIKLQEPPTLANVDPAMQFNSWAEFQKAKDSGKIQADTLVSVQTHMEFQETSSVYGTKALKFKRATKTRRCRRCLSYCNMPCSFC